MLAIWILDASEEETEICVSKFRAICCLQNKAVQSHFVVNFNLASDLLKKVKLKLLSEEWHLVESFDPDHADLLLVSCMFELNLNIKTQRRTRNEHV